MEQAVLSTLRATATVDIQGIYYRPESGLVDALEAVAFVLEGGSTAIFTNGTDWTLRAQAGVKRGLPKWCYPLTDWKFGRIAGVSPVGGFREVARVTEELSSSGEAIGITAHYPQFAICVYAGEPLRVAAVAL